MIETPLSVLEVTVVESGRQPRDAITGAVELARRVEEFGYRRVWYAEHHYSPGLADFPPAVVIAHVAAVTSTIRVGSGGVLAPNHAPLSLAEQFAALSALHPGRIDLGIGRGPGTFDEATARALRRGAAPTTDEEYGEDVAAILRHAADRPEVPEPWLLASSTAGAGLAARLGLPLAFAHHLKPENTAECLDLYRTSFTPSRWCETPQVILSVQTVCASTQADAEALVRPADIAMLSLLVEGRERQLLDPRAAAEHVFTAQEENVLATMRRHQILGTPQTVRRRLTETAERFGVDELMLVTPVYDWENRARSFQLITQARTG